MFCSHCGTKLPDDAKFCSNCGKVISQHAYKEENVTEENVTEENVTEENVTEENVTEVNVTEGNVIEGNIVEENSEIDEYDPAANQEEFISQVNDYPIFTSISNTYRSAGESTDDSTQDIKTLNTDSSTQDVKMDNTEKAAKDESSAKTHKKAKKNKKTVEKKKSKKKVVIAACITGVILVLAGGAVYCKSKLDHLEDSIQTFHALINEKSLAEVTRYQDLLLDGEDVVDHFKILEIADIEEQIKNATAECKELSNQLILLSNQKCEYETLDRTLILEDSEKELIQQKLNEFDNAVTAGDDEKATTLINDLANQKEQIIVQNRETAMSRLEGFETYDNQDMNEKDQSAISQSIDQIRRSMDQDNYQQAQNQMDQLERTLTAMEERINEEKQAQAIAELSARPEVLVLMIDGSVFTEDENRDALEQALESRLGFDIVFWQYPDSGYYDAVSASFTSSILPDVILLQEEQYFEYASLGYLADITSYWEESVSTHNYTSVTNQTMGALAVDGKIYGFTPMQAEGAVTYVRQDWLDQVGLDLPSNYEEFYAMLQAFTENAMDGTKETTNTYGMTAAGYLQDSMPYQMYLQEFYQDANPDFYQTEDGSWVDGFAQDSMIQALTRLQNAQAEGLLDPNMASNTTEDAMNQFITGKCGVISALAGQTGDELSAGLKQNGIEAEITVLTPIAEVGQYVTKNKSILAVTQSCAHPGGVMKYFFEPMLNDDELRVLLTFGVQGIHWDTTAQTIQYGTEVEEYEEGQFHSLAYGDAQNSCYSYNFIDPLSILQPFNLHYDMQKYYSNVAVLSKQIINQYGGVADSHISNEVLNSYEESLLDIRREVIEAVLLDGEDPLAAVQEYQYYTEDTVTEILEILNQQ